MLSLEIVSQVMPEGPLADDVSLFCAASKYVCMHDAMKIGAREFAKKKKKK